MLEDPEKNLKLIMKNDKIYKKALKKIYEEVIRAFMCPLFFLNI